MSNRSQRNEVEKEKNAIQDADQTTGSITVETKPQESIFVYAGTSLPKGALQQFSVFKNGLPVAVSEHIEKCPAIGQLMVPVSELALTRQNLGVVGSRENTLNMQIQSYVRGEK